MNDDTITHQYSATEESQCLPADVLELLLSLIAPDGSVRFCYDPDDPEANWETVPPHQPVPLENLADQVYAARLLRVARLLFHLCQRINTQRLPTTNPSLRSAAVELTAYQHDPTFLHEALRLIMPDGQGNWIQPPRLHDTDAAKRRQQK